MAFQKFLAAGGSSANFIIRLMVGSVFFLEGIKKFLFAEQWGAGRFARIGIPVPFLTGPFVGAVETVCGLLLLLGLFTRLASLPLIIDISVAIATTKIPIFVKSGFWPMEAEARTDFCMLMALIFLLIAGAGPLSADKLIAPRPRLK
jgi:putative oxidoreductase